jgi:2-polyprenyl-6-methoxyphenol hydroxylase-like FAD-dependent oxidoreductase
MSQVDGVELEGGERIKADLVVDAAGRSSKSIDWISAAGLPPVSELSAPCGLMYYSRHYRLNEGVPAPPYVSLLAGPRGDLNYLAYAILVGDSRTYCLCIMPPPWDRELRALRDPDAFQRLAMGLPGVPSWVDPEVASPISPVLPMGQLRNTLRTFVANGEPVVPGLQPIGDALCHTNPTFAYGASLALQHAFILAEVLNTATDVGDIALRFHEAAGRDAEKVYRAVVSEDRDRARRWGGGEIDVTDPDASMPLFLRSVVYRVAMNNSSILRAVARRTDLLDLPDLLERDEDLLERSRAIYKELCRAGEFVPGPQRTQLLGALAA